MVRQVRSEKISFPGNKFRCCVARNAFLCEDIQMTVYRVRYPTVYAGEYIFTQ